MPPVMLTAMLAVRVFAMLELALIEVLLGSAVAGVLVRMLTCAADSNLVNTLLIPNNACSFFDQESFESVVTSHSRKLLHLIFESLY